MSTFIPEPSDLALPFPAWRLPQEYALSRIIAHEKPITLLEAPTGIGKSGIALGAAALFNKQATILTGTKQLQSQYINLGAAPVFGRANYDCPLPEEVASFRLHGITSAENAPCIYGYDCPIKARGECPYYSAKDKAVDADAAVLNYAYYLALSRGHDNPFASSDRLLVMDEAHSLDSELMRTLEVRLTWRNHLYTKQPPRSEHPEHWTEWAGDVYSDVMSQMKVHHHEKDVQAYLKARAFVSKLDILLAIDHTWVVTRDEIGASIKPSWIMNFGGIHSMLHGAPHKKLLMSASILDPDLYCAMLGLRPDEVEYIKLDSTFEATLRPLIVAGAQRVSGNVDYEQLVKDIDYVIDNHSPEKGIVHTVNYHIAQEIMARSRYKHLMVTHNSADRAVVLELFRTEPQYEILVSPSMGTGVDLPYDQCRWQIIAKLPFPDRGDPQIKKRLSYGPHGEDDPTLGERWYNWATACALVQTYGRIMRAEDDWGSTYILDRNWDWWYRRNKHLIPPWVQDAIV